MKLEYLAIRQPRRSHGLFSDIIRLLSCLIHFEAKFAHKYSPIIDWRNCFHGGNCATENVWEHYFLQPANIGLEVPHKTETGLKEGVIHYNAYASECQEEVIELVRKIAKKYIKIRPEILQECNSLQEKIRSRRTLGVHYRNTDMLVLHPEYNSPDLTTAIEQTELLFTQLGCDQVFLATESNESLEGFRLKFGKCLLYTDCFRVTEFDDRQTAKEIINNNFKHFYEHPRERHRYLLGKEAVIDMFLLTQCDYFLQSLSSLSNMTVFCGDQAKEKIFCLKGHEDKRKHHDQSSTE